MLEIIIAVYVLGALVSAFLVGATPSMRDDAVFAILCWPLIVLLCAVVWPFGVMIDLGTRWGKRNG